MFIHRLICCIVGHAPFPKWQGKSVPPAQFDSSTTIIGGPNTYMATNGLGGVTWTNTQEAALKISHGPFNAELGVCSRCHGVYWTADVRAPLVASDLPELNDYVAWRKRDQWEAKQRENNETADKLYRQYQVALKLAHNDDK